MNVPALIPTLPPLSRQACRTAARLNRVAERTVGLLTRSQVLAWERCSEAALRETRRASHVSRPDDWMDAQFALAAAWGWSAAETAAEVCDMQARLGHELTRWWWGCLER